MLRVRLGLLLTATGLLACGERHVIGEDPDAGGGVDAAAVDGGDDDVDSGDNPRPRDAGGEEDGGQLFDSGPEEECERPGAIEEVACGWCGSAERFCTSRNVWEYGPCRDEGVCEPGAVDELECGNCGTQPARCTLECEWDRVGECADEGECAPESIRWSTEACEGGLRRLEVCSSSCEYEPEGECEERAPVDVMLLFDVTGSFAGTVQAQWESIRSNFIEPLLEVEDTYVGVSFFGDFPRGGFGGEGDRPFAAGVAPTDDPADFADVVVPSYAGADAPESWVEALGIVAGLPAHPLVDEPFDCPVGRLDGGCFREGVSRFVVLFTDAPAHNGPARTPGALYEPYFGIEPAPLTWPVVSERYGVPSSTGRIGLLAAIRTDLGRWQIESVLEDAGLSSEDHIRGFGYDTEEWPELSAWLIGAVDELR